MKMSLVEHPIAQKIFVGTAVLAFGGIAGGLVTTRDKVIQHEQKITTIEQISPKIEKIADSVTLIEKDVAVLKDRSDKSENTR